MIIYSIHKMWPISRFGSNRPSLRQYFLKINSCIQQTLAVLDGYFAWRDVWDWPSVLPPRESDPIGQILAACSRQTTNKRGAGRIQSLIGQKIPPKMYPDAKWSQMLRQSWPTKKLQRCCSSYVYFNASGSIEVESRQKHTKQRIAFPVEPRGALYMHLKW